MKIKYMEEKTIEKLLFELTKSANFKDTVNKVSVLLDKI